MYLRTFIPLFLVGGVLLMVLYHEPSNSFGYKEKINGVSLVNPPFTIDSMRMAEVKRVNSDWVAVIPIAFSRKNEPIVHFNHQRQWWGERVDGTARLIELAHQNQLQVMLKPHVWLREQWIGDFDLDSESKWKEWEVSYREYIMTFVQLADSLQVSMFCIGTELKVAAQERPEYWRQLIRDIRTFYNGKLVYAANWDEYEQISFWDQLDYIGIDGYFPLVGDANPAAVQIDKAWRPIVKKLKRFSDQLDKQILFTEYGYQSLDGSAGNHWEVIKSTEALNPDLQARSYECLYKSLWEEPWFAGGFLWKWHFRENAGGLSDGNFTPQGKPAEYVIARWYGKSQRKLISRED